MNDSLTDSISEDRFALLGLHAFCKEGSVAALLSIDRTHLFDSICQSLLTRKYHEESVLSKSCSLACEFSDYPCVMISP